MRTHRLLHPLLLLTAGIVLTGLAAAEGLDGPSGNVVEFTRKPDFAFLSWEKGTESVAGGLRLQAVDSRGGIGFNVTADLAALADATPQLSLTLGPANRAKAIRATFNDADGTRHEYRFKLEGLTSGQATVVRAESGDSLREPVKVGAEGSTPGFDAAHVTQATLQGDWTDAPVDLTVTQLGVVPPDAATLAARAARRETAAREAEARRVAEVERARLRTERLANPVHPTDGATVVAVGLVARDILAIQLQDGDSIVPGLEPYVAQAADERRAKGKPRPDWDAATGRFADVTDTEIFRMVGGRRVSLGTLSPDGAYVLPGESLAGAALDTALIDDPQAYAVQSADDPAYAAPVAPVAVYRKCKPTGRLVGSRQPLRHHLYLRLPSPPVDGATYSVRLAGLNTRDAQAMYRHVTAEIRSEAVQAIQTGYRPDDPFKRASLAIWLGTGGGYQHERVARFEVLDDASGAVVFTGQPVLAKAKDAPEAFKETKDYAHTAVWSLAFGTFAQPGRYRVHVPGMGCSAPFEIAGDVWLRAFRTAMRGLLHQRNGLALEAPWASFTRARPFHPDDGVRFFQMTITLPEGQEGARGKNLLELQDAGRLEEVRGLWGGYQDAGDWDSLGTHLAATQLLLELADLRPAFAAGTKLSLPPAETANARPDLLDEALWNLASFRRLQRPDGGVRGGYGQGWGAREADTSPMGKAVGVYAPDVQTTLKYAGCAAVAARLLEPLDAADAADYRASAVKAWQWATERPTAKAERDRARWSAYAAVELLRLTGEPTYREAFLADTELTSPGTFVDQPEASFAYARLPADLTDPARRSAAVELFRAAAERALAFAGANGYGVITDRTDLPVISYVGYFSTPGMASQNLPRAHYLTGDPRHLAAVVQACNYTLGANPEGRTFTVGLGHESPRYPLHLDSRRTGQTAPVGITVFGAADETSPMSRGWNAWVHTWHAVGMTPHPSQWPAQESNLDIFQSPSLCEYTVHQQLGPMAYYLGYLAARP